MILERVFGRKKYVMPDKVGFIKWTPTTVRGGYPEKKIELHLAERIEIMPFINTTQIRIIENEMGVPIIDLTGGVAPKFVITDEFNPGEIEISRFW